MCRMVHAGGEKNGTIPKTVALTEAANDAADRMAKRFGMKKNVLVERILLWMDVQHDAIQVAATKNLVEGFEVATLELVLKQLKAEQRRSRGKRPPATNLLVDITDPENVEVVPNPRAR